MSAFGFSSISTKGRFGNLLQKSSIGDAVAFLSKGAANIRSKPVIEPEKKVSPLLDEVDHLLSIITSPEEAREFLRGMVSDLLLENDGLRENIEGLERKLATAQKERDVLEKEYQQKLASLQESVEGTSNSGSGDVELPESTSAPSVLTQDRAAEMVIHRLSQKVERLGNEKIALQKEVEDSRCRLEDMEASDGARRPQVEVLKSQYLFINKLREQFEAKKKQISSLHSIDDRALLTREETSEILIVTLSDEVEQLRMDRLQLEAELGRKNEHVASMVSLNDKNMHKIDALAAQIQFINGLLSRYEQKIKGPTAARPALLQASRRAPQIRQQGPNPRSHQGPRPEKPGPRPGPHQGPRTGQLRGPNPQSHQGLLPGPHQRRRPGTQQILPPGQQVGPRRPGPPPGQQGLFPQQYQGPRPGPPYGPQPQQPPGPWQGTRYGPQQSPQPRQQRPRSRPYYGSQPQQQPSRLQQPQPAPPHQQRHQQQAKLPLASSPVNRNDSSNSPQTPNNLTTFVRKSSELLAKGQCTAESSTATTNGSSCKPKYQHQRPLGIQVPHASHLKTPSSEAGEKKKQQQQDVAEDAASHKEIDQENLGDEAGSEEIINRRQKESAAVIFL